MNLASLSTIQNLCTQLGITPQRSRGQNFLIDDEVLTDIVDAAMLTKKDTILEIGPGFGVLTEALAARAGTVIAVELDRTLAQYLQKELKQQNVTIVQDDILKYLNISTCTYSKVVANLPYQITSRVLRVLLEVDHTPDLLVFMMQKEVAERVVARPGDMSMLSVMVQYYAMPEIIRIVPRTSFWPEPEVDSAVVRITPHVDPGSGAGMTSEKDFFRIVKIGFSSRRKQLANNLSVGLQITKEELVPILELCGLAPTVRAQELSLDDWKRLVHSLHHEKSEVKKN